MGQMAPALALHRHRLPAVRGIYKPTDVRFASLTLTHNTQLKEPDETYFK